MNNHQHPLFQDFGLLPSIFQWRCPFGHEVAVVATGQGDDPNFWATTVGRRDVKVTLAAPFLRFFLAVDTN